MAKLAYSKLKLSIPKDPIIVKWGDQEIEVKRYISIQEKLEMVSEILNRAADENRFYNSGKIEMFSSLGLVEHYTNISFTDKQKENPIKLYDEMIASGFYDELYKVIPNKELEFLDIITRDTVEQIYKYQNSAYGIMDAMSTDYNTLNFDAEAIKEKLSNPEDLKTLKDVLTKLG